MSFARGRCAAKGFASLWLFDGDILPAVGLGCVDVCLRACSGLCTLALPLFLYTISVGASVVPEGGRAPWYTVAHASACPVTPDC